MPLGANKAAIMGVAGVSTGDVVLISSQTASGDSAISFTSGITSTYGEYIFRFYNINPATDDEDFTFQGSIDGGSNYNVTMTTTAFRATHNEADDSAQVSYQAAKDQAQATTFQKLFTTLGNGADESLAGELILYNPSSTTYAKHFLSRTIGYEASNAATDFFVGGYFSDADDDINAIQFKMSSGNFDGKIKMWGVK